MKVAIEGCLHGELDVVYAALEKIESTEGIKVDLLLCCGDFESIRNEEDLQCMAVPEKYRKLGSFWEYYSGRKRAPILTIFIGGNHEASNYLAELFHGGWVCENIYYLGFAGVVSVGGLRIGGLSGIYDWHHFLMGHFEQPPYTEDSKRSVYHVRETDLVRLLQISEPLDIFLSHDWPEGIAFYGQTDRLIQRKPFLRDEINSRTLGSPPAAHILHTLQPRYWFSAHLHVKFPAIVRHEGSDRVTRFLALDKCLPHRDYLQLVDFPDKTEPPILCYDHEWLAIVKKTAPTLLRFDRIKQPVDTQNTQFRPSEEEKNAMKLQVPVLTIPLNFAMTAPAFDPTQPAQPLQRPTGILPNNQTAAFCAMINIPDPTAPVSYVNKDEISLDDD